MLLNVASSADDQFSRLVAFRKGAYDLLGTGRDALFDLMDANLATRSISSLAELSLSPLFRRAWSSIYEAVDDGEVPRKELMHLYCALLPKAERPLLAGDHTAWPRPQARTLRDRTIEHQPTPVPGNRPITIGQGYSTLAYIPEGQGSWALPFLHERIASNEAPIQKAADQLLEVCKAVARQAAADKGLSPVPKGYLTIPSERRPIAMYDAEYGNARFVLATAGLPADKIMRMRPNINLWGPPPPYSGSGRPREHGEKFKLSDPSTWGSPAEEITVDDPRLGKVRVRKWKVLHFRKAKGHPLMAVCVERVDAKGTRRDPKVLWLAWVVEDDLPLSEHWRDYLRRFAIDHWYRFAKGPLHWTLPQLATPERSETWSDLMPLMTWQLWLARPVLEDNPLPWQKVQTRLTPGRVCQAWAALLVHIGTPARVPKPRGKSPGWPKGRVRNRRTVHPVVKKTKPVVKKAKKAPQKAASPDT